MVGRLMIPREDIQTIAEDGDIVRLLQYHTFASRNMDNLNTLYIRHASS